MRQGLRPSGSRSQPGTPQWASNLARTAETQDMCGSGSRSLTFAERRAAVWTLRAFVDFIEGDAAGVCQGRGVQTYTVIRISAGLCDSQRRPVPRSAAFSVVLGKDEPLTHSCEVIEASGFQRTELQTDLCILPLFLWRGT